MSAILVAHTDAVWDLAVQTGSLQLLSASADGTCKLWSPTLKSPLLNSYVPGQGKLCLYRSALTSFQLSRRKISWLSKMLPSDNMVTKWYGIFSNSKKDLSIKP